MAVSPVRSIERGLGGLRPASGVMARVVFSSPSMELVTWCATCAMQHVCSVTTFQSTTGGGNPVPPRSLPTFLLIRVFALRLPPEDGS